MRASARARIKVLIREQRECLPRRLGEWMVCSAVPSSVSGGAAFREMKEPNPTDGVVVTRWLAVPFEVTGASCYAAPSSKETCSAALRA